MTFSQRIVRNAGANLVRLGAFAVVALLLPTVLVRHMVPAQYNAWVLILQMGAYVNFLDLGIQTALSKYVAEYNACRDHTSCDRVSTNALLMLLLGAALGVALSAAMALATAKLFPQMPQELLPEVRWALFFYGASMALALPASAFAGIFLGLQRYTVPMVLQSLNKVSMGAVTIAAVLLHWRIRYMGIAIAGVNIAFALAQIGSWRALAYHIRIRMRLVEAATLARLARYCSVLTLWSVAMLFVSGLDTVIVGHYDFHATAYYAVAANATSFLTALLQALMSPLVPAASALSVDRTPRQMGQLLLRATRYGVGLMLVAGLPLLLGSYVVLRVWMGADFALHGVPYLRILLIASMLRMIGLPYSVMVIGTGRQWLASISPVCEATVNFTASLILVRHIGAVGVAWGTVIGAVVGLVLHFSLSMKLTQDQFAISRRWYVTGGVLLPLLAAIPAALALRMWWHAGPPAVPLAGWAAMAIATLALLWFTALDSNDRRRVLRRS